MFPLSLVGESAFATGTASHYPCEPSMTTIGPEKAAMNLRKYLIFGIISSVLAPLAGLAQDAEEAAPQPAWAGLSDSQRRGVMDFAEDYKDFMSRAKTELSFVTEAVKVARAAGFRELEADSNLRPDRKSVV